MDENDEQCQRKDRNQDGCGLNKDRWVWGCQKSMASRITVSGVRL